MKIVVLDGYAANPNDLSWEAIAAQGELTVYDRTAPEDILARIGDAEVVYTNKAVLTREIMAACPNLKLISVLATGYNIVDTAAARELGITVCNVPAYSTDAVAQLVTAFMLEFCHHVGAHTAAVHDGAWVKSPDFTFWHYPLIELAGKTLGIVGFGSIGQRVAQIATALGMQVVYTNQRGHALRHCPYTYLPLDELLKVSDVVTLHCPLTDKTRHLINKTSLAHMKRGAFLINTARGPVVEEADVRDALIDGTLAGYAADVISAEPMAADNPLLGAPNCFITPHIGWAPFEARVRLMDISAANLAAFIAGEPQNVVN